MTFARIQANVQLYYVNRVIKSLRKSKHGERRQAQSKAEEKRDRREGNRATRGRGDEPVLDALRYQTRPLRAHRLRRTNSGSTGRGERDVEKSVLSGNSVENRRHGCEPGAKGTRGKHRNTDLLLA